MPTSRGRSGASGNTTACGKCAQVETEVRKQTIAFAVIGKDQRHQNTIIQRPGCVHDPVPELTSDPSATPRPVDVQRHLEAAVVATFPGTREPLQRSQRPVLAARSRRAGSLAPNRNGQTTRAAHRACAARCPLWRCARVPLGCRSRSFARGLQGSLGAGCPAPRAHPPSPALRR